MDDKEKNAEVAKAIKLPDLASYMQVVIKQLEIDKKWSAVHTYTYTLKSVTEFYGGKGTPVPIYFPFTSFFRRWARSMNGIPRNRNISKKYANAHCISLGNFSISVCSSVFICFVSSARLVCDSTFVYTLSNSFGL